jgi:hypothetical protein
MTRRQVIYIAGGAGAAAVIAFGFIAGRQELAKEREREAPVTAPSRLREVRTSTGVEAAIVLDTLTEQLIGIQTVALGRATRRNGTILLTGELVADPARVTTIRAPVPGRVTALGGPWPVLGEELAAERELAQVSDARPLVVPRSGVVTRVSAQPGELVQAGQELVQLTDFRDPLARIVWRLDLPLAPPQTLTVAPLGGLSSGALARYVAPAAEVDTLTRAPVFLYRVSANWPGARPGLPLVATIQDPRTSVSGVFVPTDAVVQWEGLSWVYARHAAAADARAPGHAYVRVRVDTSRPVDGGWLAPVAGGLRSGDVLVVRGAQQLLSEEFRARVQVGNAGDKR